MDWDDVRYFLALARQGSVRSAGATLAVSHSTVARRVESLEERLGVRLFDRTPEGYCLTDSGRQMVSGAERVEKEMVSLERELLGRDEKLEGKITITCVDTYLAEFVLRELAPFCEQFPRIELEVTTTYRSVDLSKREADIALRVHRLDKSPPEHLLGRKVATLHYANYVAIDHCERLDPEVKGNNPRWLGWSERKRDEAWVAKTSYPQVPVWGSFKDTALQVQALRAGLGIGSLPCFVADRETSLRRLERDDQAPFFDIWLLSHPDLRDTARLSKAREHLANALLREAPWFRGERPSSLRA